MQIDEDLHGFVAHAPWTALLGRAVVPVVVGGLGLPFGLRWLLRLGPGVALALVVVFLAAWMGWMVLRVWPAVHRVTLTPHTLTLGGWVTREISLRASVAVEHRWTRIRLIQRDGSTMTAWPLATEGQAAWMASRILVGIRQAGTPPEPPESLHRLLDRR